MAEASTPECSELRPMNFTQQQGIDGVDIICTPLHHFTVTGPNGDHYCFIYPLLGPKVIVGLSRNSETLVESLRRIGFQLTKAVEILHAHGVCHGGK